MSSVFHRFSPPCGDEPERCGHVTRWGEPCGRLASSHSRDARKGDRHKSKKDRHESKKDRHKNRPRKAEQPFVFFDTEGRGDGDSHKLVYGAAVDETGRVVLEIQGRGSRAQPPPEAWLDALLEMGKRTKQRSCFAYGFGYDRTKMLEGLPAKTLYLLTHREERPRSEKNPKNPIPLYWGEYQLDLQGTRFSVARLRRHPDGRPMTDSRGRRQYDRMTVWDVLKFFQAPFVDALDAWRKKESRGENLDSKLVVPDAALEEMRAMKARRTEFDRMPWDRVKKYCQSECLYGARLVRELVTACAGIGVELRRFDGAGSVSDALMKNWRVGEHMSAKNVTCRYSKGGELQGAFLDAIMRAFFGGRFETAYCGVVRRPIYAKDIASAYPYAMYFLPCLACGQWSRAKTRRDAVIESAELALIRVQTFGWDKNQAFGSLPNRDKKGNITFPIQNTVWCWKHEYLTARDVLGDRVRVLDAYVYRTSCDHQPFRFMAKLYLERLRIGKEGRGIAMKLGYNGCAGKTMQRVGAHRWQEYMWAGNITSRTRAQLLEAMGRFKNSWDIAYLATDSVFAFRDMSFPEPEGTGTQGASKWGKPSLGAWEAAKPFEKGMCLVRPGIAFPLKANAQQMKEIKARGISKNVLLENVDDVVRLMSSQKRLEDEGACLQFSRRIFNGMKMSVRRGGDDAYSVSERYGQWCDQPIKIMLEAQPKRLCRLPGEEGALLPWPSKSESLPYRYDKRSSEARALEELSDVLSEQPDLDSVDVRAE